MNVTLNLTASAETPPIMDLMEKTCQPYKLRERTTGDVCVVIKVPTNEAQVYTLLVLEQRNICWNNTRPDGLQYFNATYDFVGPLERGESVTISG